MPRCGFGRAIPCLMWAAGPGLCFPWIQDHIGPSGKLIAVEPSREMLDKAMQRVAQRGWDNVIPINAAATELVDHRSREPAGGRQPRTQTGTTP